MRRIIAILAGAVVLLFLVALPAPWIRYVLGHDYAFGLVPLAERAFDLNAEENVPTWFASSILLLTSLLLLGIGLVERALKRTYARHWLILSGIFLFLSMDEAAVIHEEANVLGEILGLSGIFYFTWVIFGAALVAAVGIGSLGFLRHLPSKTRKLFLLSGAIFVGGALGLELVQSTYADGMGEAYWTSPLRIVLTHVEESMEMGGIVLFIYGLLDYSRTHIGSFHITIRAPEKAPEAGIEEIPRVPPRRASRASGESTAQG